MTLWVWEGGSTTERRSAQQRGVAITTFWQARVTWDLWKAEQFLQDTLVRCNRVCQTTWSYLENKITTVCFLYTVQAVCWGHSQCKTACSSDSLCAWDKGPPTGTDIDGISVSLDELLVPPLPRAWCSLGREEQGRAWDYYEQFLGLVVCWIYCLKSLAGVQKKRDFSASFWSMCCFPTVNMQLKRFLRERFLSHDISTIAPSGIWAQQRIAGGQPLGRNAAKRRFM